MTKALRNNELRRAFLLGEICRLADGAAGVLPRQEIGSDGTNWATAGRVLCEHRGTAPVHGEKVERTLTFDHVTVVPMGCTLHVTGTHLEPASALAGTQLTAYRQHRAGERRVGGPNEGQPWPYGGFSVNVSDSDDFQQAIADAIAFLRLHLEPLRAIVSGDSVEDARLDFSRFCRIGCVSVTQCDYLVPELVQLAGHVGLGIELSLYPVSGE